jgi:AcrR family transcriptional regulator
MCFSPYSIHYALGAMPAPRIEVLPRRPRASLREELRASQRGRLICAIADAVAAEGYPATSVADVIVRAGVSRRTFYEHFADKEACFLAAYDSGAQAIYDAMVEAIHGLSRWEEILASVLSTWLASLDADLAFTRAYMIEFWAAGDAARERWKERRDRTANLLKLLHEQIRAQDPAVAEVSDTLVAAVVGGVNRVVVSHVLAGDDAPLATLAPELQRFVTMVLAAPAARG